MGFHINKFDGVTSGWYAVREPDGRESGVFPFRWMAWLAGVAMELWR